MRTDTADDRDEMNGCGMGVTESSGNVFDDLGLADADTLLAKSVLALHIKRAIQARGLTQQEAA